MKAEIDSLQYAVCALMCKLEMLLVGHFGHPTLMVGDGVTMSTPEHLPPHSVACVTVHPIGWPEGSYVQARLINGHNGWSLLEAGEIYAPHTTLKARVHFKPTDDGFGLRLDPTAEYDRGTAYSGYTRLIEALGRDQEKIPIQGWGV